LLANKKLKKIEDIKVGDIIRGIDYLPYKEGHWAGKAKPKNKAREVLYNNEVKEVHENEVDEYYEISFDTIVQGIVRVPKTVKVTGNHPFYMGEGKYVAVEDLNIGDILYNYTPVRECGKCPWIDRISLTRITAKKLVKEKLTVYNLSVDGSL